MLLKLAPADSEHGVIAYSTQSNASGTGKSIAVQAFLHFAVVVIPAVLIALPGPSRYEMSIDITIAVLGVTNMVVAVVFVILQVPRAVQRDGETRRSSGSFELAFIVSTSARSRLGVFTMAGSTWEPDLERAGGFALDMVYLEYAGFELWVACGWVCGSGHLLLGLLWQRRRPGRRESV